MGWQVFKQTEPARWAEGATSLVTTGTVQGDVQWLGDQYGPGQFILLDEATAKYRRFEIVADRTYRAVTQVGAVASV